MVGALELLGAPPRRFDHGEVITRQGDPVPSLSLVAWGVVRLSAVTSAGREVVIGLLGRGDLFGESALFEPEAPSPVRASVVGSATVVELPACALRAILQENPATSMELLRLIGARLHRTAAQLQEALGHDVATRISDRLRALARDHGTADPDGVRLRIALPQEELARMVGTSRETVNRTLAAMSSRGLVRTEGRHLVIPDPAALERERPAFERERPALDAAG